MRTVLTAIPPVTHSSRDKHGFIPMPIPGSSPTWKRATTSPPPTSRGTPVNVPQHQVTYPDQGTPAYQTGGAFAFQALEIAPDGHAVDPELAGGAPGRRPADHQLRRRDAAGTGIRPADVADTVIYILTRPAHVSIRDLVILPVNQEI